MNYKEDIKAQLEEFQSNGFDRTFTPIYRRKDTFPFTEGNLYALDNILGFGPILLKALFPAFSQKTQAFERGRGRETGKEGKRDRGG